MKDLQVMPVRDIWWLNSSKDCCLHYRIGMWPPLSDLRRPVTEPGFKKRRYELNSPSACAQPAIPAWVTCIRGRGRAHPPRRPVAAQHTASERPREKQLLASIVLFMQTILPLFEDTRSRTLAEYRVQNRTSLSS